MENELNPIDLNKEITDSSSPSIMQTHLGIGRP